MCSNIASELGASNSPINSQLYYIYPGTACSLAVAACLSLAPLPPPLSPAYTQTSLIPLNYAASSSQLFFTYSLSLFLSFSLFFFLSLSLTLSHPFSHCLSDCHRISIWHSTSRACLSSRPGWMCQVRFRQLTPRQMAPRPPRRTPIVRMRW